MIPNRVSVKYFVTDPGVVDLDAFIPVYHNWIQKHAVEGLLIDVADYKHVRQGPGIILIGHEGDYGMDLAEGRPGLMYTRKRQIPNDLGELLRLTFRLALTASKLLASEPAFKSKLKFSTAEAEVVFQDRLRVPNRPETFDEIRETLQTVVNEIYGDTGAKLERVQNDPRQCLTVKIVAPEAPITSLVERLEVSRAATA